MFRGQCSQNVTPRMNCSPDPRMANARAAAVACAGIRSGQCVDLFDSQAEVRVEPAVVTAPNIFNHHRRVEHIVPVITEDIHRFHNHHQFVARPEPRIRQTFDSDISIGRPLLAQQFTQAPTMQQQMVPFEVDVTERFGFVPQNANWGTGMSQQGQTMQPVAFGNQAFEQIQGQNFF